MSIQASNHKLYIFVSNSVITELPKNQQKYLLRPLRRRLTAFHDFHAVNVFIYTKFIPLIYVPNTLDNSSHFDTSAQHFSTTYFNSLPLISKGEISQMTTLANFTVPLAGLSRIKKQWNFHLARVAPDQEPLWVASKNYTSLCLKTL